MIEERRVEPVGCCTVHTTVTQLEHHVSCQMQSDQQRPGLRSRFHAEAWCCQKGAEAGPSCVTAVLVLSDSYTWAVWLSA